jgi:hypothetical protein
MRQGTNRLCREGVTKNMGDFSAVTGYVFIDRPERAKAKKAIVVIDALSGFHLETEIEKTI